jgi:GTP-binding protein YchF
LLFDNRQRLSYDEIIGRADGAPAARMLVASTGPAARGLSPRTGAGMALTVGIIGLPNVGKSTLLNALARAGAEASNYPFCTIERNCGVVAVPDERLLSLAGILEPKEVIPSTVTYIDIAGLVAGASRGEGLGNKFLHHIREANVLAHVLRCFKSQDVSHVHGTVDPVHDLEVVETELMLADIERIGKWIEREEHKAKAKRKDERTEIAFLEGVREKLSRGERVMPEEIQKPDAALFDELNLLTSKPCLYVLNAGEDDPRGAGPVCRAVADAVGAEHTFIVSARLEEELAAIDDGDREEFMRELGIDREAKKRFIEKCHELLGLIRYYTTAHGKLQAWSLVRGTSAPRAAGGIHSDMERGYIRAEVMGYDDLIAFGSKAEVQHHGHLRTEGHDYIVQDGDIIEFHFKR